MTLGGTSSDFSQGALTLGGNFDMAIVGEGLFVLNQAPSSVTSSTASEHAFTRNGHFSLDANSRYIVDSYGRQLYGYRVDESGNTIDKTLVPIQSDGNVDVGFTEGGLFVTNFDKYKTDLAAGSQTLPVQKPLYKVALTTFPNKSGLIRLDGSAYVASASSGQPVDYGVSGTGQYGTVLGSKLESSNINVAKVALNMALLNRNYAAIQGLIDDLNKIMSGLISKLQ